MFFQELVWRAFFVGAVMLSNGIYTQASDISLWVGRERHNLKFELCLMPIVRVEGVLIINPANNVAFSLAGFHGVNNRNRESTASLHSRMRPNQGGYPFHRMSSENSKWIGRVWPFRDAIGLKGEVSCRCVAAVSEFYTHKVFQAFRILHSTKGEQSIYEHKCSISDFVVPGLAIQDGFLMAGVYRQNTSESGNSYRGNPGNNSIMPAQPFSERPDPPAHYEGLFEILLGYFLIALGGGVCFGAPGWIKPFGAASIILGFVVVVFGFLAITAV